MSRQIPTSDEVRNAFVDDELSVADGRRVRELSLEDAELRLDLCELQSVKALVRDAYSEVEPPAARRQNRPLQWRLVASVACACLLAGWLARGWIASAEWEDPTRVVDISRFKRAVAAAPVRSDRLLLHVSSRDPDDLHSTMQTAASMLEGAAQQGRPIAVEIIANGAGLDLLRADRSPLADRVIALSEKHPNLKLIACNLTMDRLRRRGETVALLPGVRVVPSALDEIVDRLNSGWLYIRT